MHEGREAHHRVSVCLTLCRLTISYARVPPPSEVKLSEDSGVRETMHHMRVRRLLSCLIRKRVGDGMAVRRQAEILYLQCGMVNVWHMVNE